MSSPVPQAMGFRSRSSVLASQPHYLFCVLRQLSSIFCSTEERPGLWQAMEACPREKDWGRRAEERESGSLSFRLSPSTSPLYTFSANSKTKHIHRHKDSFPSETWSGGSSLEIQTLPISRTLTVFLANSYPSLLRPTKQWPWLFPRSHLEASISTRWWVTQGSNHLSPERRQGKGREK